MIAGFGENQCLCLEFSVERAGEVDMPFPASYALSLRHSFGGLVITPEV